MKYNIKISVVLSTKNPDKQHLYDAIKSIVDQSLKPFEIIIVDDASKLAISDWFNKEFIDSSIRFKIIRNDESKGLAHALNLGIRAAQGNFIARMDDDDFSYPKRLETQIKYMVNGNMECCFTGVEVFGDGFEYEKKIIHRNMNLNNIRRRLLMRGNPFCHSSALYSTSLFNDVGGYNENLLYAQDYDLWIRMSEHGKIGYCEEVLVKWRYAGTKKSKEKEALQEAFCEYARYYAFLKSKQTIVDILILLYSYIYSSLQIIFIRRKQFYD